MKSYRLVLFVMLWGGFVHAQEKQDSKSFSLFAPQKETVAQSREPLDLLRTSPTAPAIPPSTPDRFDEGLFTAKEQVHDTQISDLSVRVTFLEGRSSFLSGAFWAIAILFASIVGLLKLFWKGIVKVLLAEAAAHTPTSEP